MAEKIPEQISEIDFGDNLKLHKVQTQHSIPYRPDIDGMRAIAVGIVVLFHAWPSIISGGFVGVDIFFVISGYLITQIILKQNRKGTFSYINFYNRRIKRIFPALLILLLFVLILGVTKLRLGQLWATMKTFMASTLFNANTYMMLYQPGYFDVISKINPLLHLWSLGVEEQFYIFWPFFICFLSNKLPKKMVHFLLTFTLLSFILNVFYAYRDTKIDFFSPFCRFWQMSIGGLLALECIQISNNKINKLLSPIGILMILIASFLLSESNLFPGWWALLPTLGSACIILAGPNSYINNKILATKGMIFVGKISYSLYLWHWPLLKIFRMMYPKGSTSIFAYTVTILVVSVCCSIASYNFIQTPIRTSKKKFISFFLLFSMLLLGASAYYVNKNSINIFKSRWDYSLYQQIEHDMIPSQQDYFTKNGRKYPNSSKNKNRSPPNATKIKFLYDAYQVIQIQRLLDEKIDRSSKFYRQKLPKFMTHYEVTNQGQQNLLLVVGDSYGNVVARFQKLYEDAVRQNRTSQFPTVVCMVAPGVNFLPQFSVNKFALEWIQQFKPNRILLIYKMDLYFDDPQLKQMATQISALIKRLSKVGTKVAVSTLRPAGERYNPTAMVDNNGVIQENVKPLNFTQFREANKKTIEYFEGKIIKAGGQIIDYCLNQCWGEVCEVLSPRGASLFTDSVHYHHFYSRHWMSAADHLVQF